MQAHRDVAERIETIEKIGEKPVSSARKSRNGSRKGYNDRREPSPHSAERLRLRSRHSLSNGKGSRSSLLRIAVTGDVKDQNRFASETRLGSSSSGRRKRSASARSSGVRQISESEKPTTIGKRIAEGRNRFGGR